MKKIICRLVLTCVLGFVPSLYAQQLTSLQLAGLAAQKAAVSNAEFQADCLTLLNEMKGSQLLTSEQLADQEEIDEEMAMINPTNCIDLAPATKSKLVVVSGNTTATQLALGARFSPMMQQAQTGSSLIAQLITEAGVTQNQMYGIGDFTGNAWDTTSNIFVNPIQWPWGVAPRLLAPTINGYMATSYLYNKGGMPTGIGILDCSTPFTDLAYTNSNGVVIYDVQNYIMRFQYRFLNPTGNSFRCTYSVTNGPVIANLLATTGTNWNEVTVVITNLVQFTKMNWVVSSSGSIPQPIAELDAVQFIPIPGPSTNGISLSANIDGTNTIVNLQWNTLLYDPIHWRLLYTPDLSLPMATNNVSPIVTDYVASISFTNSVDLNMFYRFVHK